MPAEHKRPSRLTSLPAIQKLRTMALCSPDAAACVSPPPLLGRAILLLFAGCVALAAAGCFHTAPAPIPPTQQQLEAYAQAETALRRDASTPKEEQQDYCEQLASAAPGVEELRTNHGAVESRQWTLLANGSRRQWVFVRVADGSPDGWAPKPGIDKLDFQPPLEPALSPGASHFLAYAPMDTTNVDDGRKSTTIKEVFGPAQGSFTWRGRKYSYTLTPSLPCFPQAQ
jgi:hypothetical protein